MCSSFLKQAAAGPLFLPDIRTSFQARGTRPFHIRAVLYDRSVRVFPLLLPEADGEQEEAFLAEYIHASIYNILSALGAVGMDICLDRSDRALTRLAGELNRVFQTGEDKRARSGYGKCLNVNERVLSALFQGRERFAFRVLGLEEEPAAPAPSPACAETPVFARLPRRLQGRLLLGMDVGGTDVKLAVSAGGQLVLCKEFDWRPSAFTRAEELTGPLLLLTRLLRAAGSLCMAGRAEELDRAALDRQAGLAAMERGAEAMECAAGPALRSFDAIGLSFPDVVIQNRIVGGETPKTLGMRNNPHLNYEDQLAKIAALNEALQDYVVPGGPVLCVNDGPMAAFTAAVEQAAGGADLSEGFFAHSLGTDLGTGWVRPDGAIPDLPLEVYNFVLDLGSWSQRGFGPEDVRSVRSVNTGLPGALQRYGGQSAVFRLAAGNPELCREALDRGLFRWEGERLVVPARPEDMRKPCLEFFMERACRPGPAAEIFRTVGAYLAATTQELDHILQPGTAERTLFGRMVKHPACFQLLCEGAARRLPGLRLRAADGSLANTGLMHQLSARSDSSVAQFAQAVGAVYYSCLGLD